MSDIDARYEKLIEETIDSDIKFEGRVFKTIVKTVKLSDGSTSFREIVKHNGGACVLAVDDDLNCYMVRQFRSPFEEILLEVPAGKIEIGEDPKVCAIRELHEEAGLIADEIIELGQEIVSPGYDSEIIHLYAARGLHYIGEKPDEGEFLNCEKIPLKELARMADNGEIRDSKTLLCIYKTIRRLGLESI